MGSIWAQDGLVSSRKPETRTSNRVDGAKNGRLEGPFLDDHITTFALTKQYLQ